MAGPGADRVGILWFCVRSGDLGGGGGGVLQRSPSMPRPTRPSAGDVLSAVGPIGPLLLPPFLPLFLSFFHPRSELSQLEREGGGKRGWGALLSPKHTLAEFGCACEKKRGGSAAK